MGYVKCAITGRDLFPESGRDILMSEINEELAAEYDPQRLEDNNWRNKEKPQRKTVRKAYY